MWSLGGLLIKSVNANPLAIAGSRSAIAVVLLLLVLKKPKMTWSSAQIGAALAYAANEDRRYLFASSRDAVFPKLERKYARGELSADRLGEIIAALIFASRRRPSAGGLVSADALIFDKGLAYRTLVPSGRHRLVFEFFSGELPESGKKSVWTIRAGGMEHAARLRKTDRGWALYTGNIKNAGHLTGTLEDFALGLERKSYPLSPL